jgi:hypothetical protein
MIHASPPEGSILFTRASAYTKEHCRPDCVSCLASPSRARVAVPASTAEKANGPVLLALGDSGRLLHQEIISWRPRLSTLTYQ